jgi:hypothetical protein
MMVDANEVWTPAQLAAYYARQGAREGAQDAARAFQVQQTAGQSSPRPPEAEQAFLNRIRRLAKAHGYLVYHTYRSDRSEPGFPDLICVRPDGVLFIEAKTNTGKLTKDQALWMAMLHAAGQEVYVWRPRDWEAIMARLTKVAQHDDEEERPQC